MTEVRLRPATSPDVAQIAALLHRCWLQTYSDLLPASAWDHLTEAARHGLWHQLLDKPNPGLKVTVAQHGVAMIGAAWARIDHTPGDARASELFGLYVLAEHHGSGVGQTLMDDVLGDEPATLWVAGANQRAIAFYRRNGFRDDGGRDALEVAPGAQLSVIRMAR